MKRNSKKNELFRDRLNQLFTEWERYLADDLAWFILSS